MSLKPAGPIVRFEKISKTFGTVAANSEVSFSVAAHSIHGIVGENGAGKSTLMNILYGMYPQDSGQIFWNDQEVHFSSPQGAIELGIGMVHQHFKLIPTLTVWENIAIDRRLTLGKINREEILNQLDGLKAQFGFSVDLRAVVETLSVGHQQQVEILKLLYRNANLLILDEPTAVLTPQEVEAFFEQLKRLQAEGKTVLIITHKLREIFKLTETVTVMRGGKVICTEPTNSYRGKEETLAEQIVGKKIVPLSSHARVENPEIAIEMKNCSLEKDGKNLLNGLNLKVGRGEILAIAGVEGNGQQSIVECLLQVETKYSGEIIFNGSSIKGKTPYEVRNMGLGVVAPDRHKEAVILDFTAEENFYLGRRFEKEFSKHGFIQKKACMAATAEMQKDFEVRPQDCTLPMRNFSGGNQQKMVIGRELSQWVKVLVASHPTRGVDLGASRFIHEELLKLRSGGVSILLISSDLDEILALADRIVVLFEGRVQGEVLRENAKVRQLGLWMTGEQG